MRNSIILSSFLAGACTQDNQLYELNETGDTAVVDSGQVDDAVFTPESCMAEFYTGDGYYFPSDFPFSVPMNVSGFNSENVFSEHFTDVRSDIFGILGLENMDGSVSYYDSLLEPETETATYGNEEYNRLTGNFIFSTNLGSLPSLNNVDAAIFIVDTACESISGFAVYNFLDSGTEKSSTLLYYSNEFGEIVYN